MALGVYVVTVMKSCAQRSIRGSFMLGGMRLFADMVNAPGLKDAPILGAGASYTWLSMQIIPSFSKWNRFLLSSKWDFSFLFSKGLARPRPISNHTSIVLWQNAKGGTQAFQI